MSDADRRLAALAAERGWAIVKVPEDGRGPGFAYTVGLFRRFGHPEVLMSGLDPDVLHDVLNDVGASVRAGARFEAGTTSDDVLEDYPVASRAIAPAAYGTYLRAGVRFHGGAPFPALHCVWPDRGGRFPWDVGGDDWARWAQPALSDGPEPVTSRPPGA